MSSSWKGEITEIIINVIKVSDWLRMHGLLTLNIKGQGQSLRLEMRCFKAKEKEALLQIWKHQHKTNPRRLYRGAYPQANKGGHVKGCGRSS